MREKVSCKRNGTAYVFLPIDCNTRMFDLHFALDAAYMGEIEDWDAFIFSDQLHPIYGNINPTSVQQPERLFVEMPDFTVGTMARFNIKMGGGSRSMRSRKMVSTHWVLLLTI